MGLAALPHRLRQSLAKIIFGAAAKAEPISGRFAFEDRYKMITLYAQAVVTLDRPAVNNRSDYPIAVDDPDLPLILDYHGELTAPTSTRRVYVRGDASKSSVYLEYKIRADKLHTVRLMLTGMDPQSLLMSFDGRDSLSLPVLVFIPRIRKTS